ncbi:MAG: lipid-A-disaccharide synthase [Prevotella sp.]|nr:lipid-A-disaccharide synthase [Prevotella sp.]
MKYYLIAGEASGDLHASHLIHALKEHDQHADFRFFGGDLMAAEGGTRVKHYRELAYMGIIPVLLHLPTILRNMRMCKQDILQWQPDVVILVDYPGFNLKIAKFVKKETKIPVYYYIAPKIWAWKEYRIKNIKRDVDELFSILPFEVDFFEKKHHYPIHYVGNPTAQEVREFINNSENSDNSDYLEYSEKPIIALLAGSRQQEIKDNLPAMIEATGHLTSQYDIILAGAPGIERSYYEKFIQGTSVKLMENQTFVLLSKATAALVTSGTATLETALFRVPQIVCYETPIPTVIAFLRKLILKVKYISLVNLIADKEVVPELVADTFSVENIRTHLGKILPEGSQRQAMLEGYDEVIRRLGDSRAPDVAAQQIYELLNNNQNN